MVYGERDLKYISKLHEFVNKFVPRGKLFWVNRLINKLPNTTCVIQCTNTRDKLSMACFFVGKYPWTVKQAKSKSVFYRNTFHVVKWHVWNFEVAVEFFFIIKLVMLICNVLFLFFCYRLEMKYLCYLCQYFYLHIFNQVFFMFYERMCNPIGWGSSIYFYIAS